MADEPEARNPGILKNAAGVIGLVSTVLGVPLLLISHNDSMGYDEQSALSLLAAVLLGGGMALCSAWIIGASQASSGKFAALLIFMQLVAGVVISLTVTAVLLTRQDPSFTPSGATIGALSSGGLFFLSWLAARKMSIRLWLSALAACLVSAVVSCSVINSIS